MALNFQREKLFNQSTKYKINEVLIKLKSISSKLAPIYDHIISREQLNDEEEQLREYLNNLMPEDHIELLWTMKNVGEILHCIHQLLFCLDESYRRDDTAFIVDRLK